MRKRVGHVVELPKRNRIRNLLQEFFSLLFGTEHAFFARGVDELRPERTQERLLFLRELGRHHEYHAHATVERCESDSETGIACGRFDDSSARLERPLRESVVHHVEACAVLHATRGVPEFKFNKQVYAFGHTDVRELYKRSLPDQGLH